MLMQAINKVTIESSLYVIDHFKNQQQESPDQVQENVRRRLNFDFLANAGSDFEDNRNSASSKPVVLKKSQYSNKSNNSSYSQDVLGQNQ